MSNHVTELLPASRALYSFASWSDFQSDFVDLQKLMETGSSLMKEHSPIVFHSLILGAVKSLAKRRLKLLSVRFDAHILLNGNVEKNSMKSNPKHFTNCVKVDCHLHTSSCATAEHLLDFVKRSFKENKV